MQKKTIKNVEKKAVNKNLKCPFCNDKIAMNANICENCGTIFFIDDKERNKISFTKSGAVKGKLTKNPKKEELIDFTKLEKNLIKKNQFYKGIKPIKLKDIIGSLGRYQDFNIEFLPTEGFSTEKLQPILKLLKKGKEFPPINVYEIEGKFFVIDGHHRIAAHLLMGDTEFIDAEIVKITIEMPLEVKKDYQFNSEQAKDFLIDLEKETFQKKTYLFNDVLIEPILVTELSSYSKLYQDLLEHHNHNLIKNPDIPIVMSALEWYRMKFLPVTRLIINNNLLKKFSERTSADLYVWLLLHKYYLSKEAKYDVGFKYTAENFMKKFGKNKYYSNLIDRFKSYIQIIVGTND